MPATVSNNASESIKSTDNFRNSLFKNNRIDERQFYNLYRLDLVEEDPAIKGIPIIFITTPDCNVTEENVRFDGFMKSMQINDSSLLNSISNRASGRPFITLLSNRMTEFNVPDLTLQTRETGETHYGYVQNLPLFAPTADSTSITYVDNNNFDVLKTHKMWFDYITFVTRGIMRPHTTAIERKYLDYTVSIYHFVLDMDGQTIQYWDKLTGCYPTNIPYSEFSSKIANNHELFEFSIEYAYSYKEFMSPSILNDFNTVSQKLSVQNKSTSMEKSIDGYDFLTDDDLFNLKMPMVFRSGNKFKLKFK